LEDKKNKTTFDILTELHQKFGKNLEAAKSFPKLAEEHEVRARRIAISREYLNNVAELKHHKEIASQFDEIFSESIISIYLASCGLNVASSMLIRRSLELGLVLVCYWDKPADYWAWKSHDEDISFSKLASHFLNDGYTTFLLEEGGAKSQDFERLIQELPNLYSKLSNVVHPKVYNFETASVKAFSLIETDLKRSLASIAEVQKTLLIILLARFPGLQARFDKEAPLPK